MRRLWPLLVAGAALVVATCSPPASDEVVTYGAGDDAPPAEAPASGESAAPQAPSAASGESPGAAAPAGPDAPPSSVAPSTTEADRAPSFAAATELPAGRLARIYLQLEPARSILVEVLEQPGAAARAGTVDHLLSLVRDVSGKRVLDGGRWAIPEDRRVWSAEQINKVVDAQSRADHEDDLVVLHVVFLRGSFEQGASVLGAATRADTFAVFVDRVADASTALVGRAEIEAAVAAHELGHVLGLVDLVLDTGRDDPEHPGHSRNKGSVMYWAVESGLVTQVLSGGPPRDFDAEDRRDLAAIRSGA